MSDYKPDMNQNNDQDLEELLQLLERLKKREEVRRYMESLADEEPHAEEKEEDMVQPARFQPTEQTAVDARDLLLLEDEEEPLQPARFQPAEPILVDAQDLLLTDMEDPLEMSEYLLIGHEDAEYENEDEDGILPPSPREKRDPIKVLWLGLRGNFPRKEDTTRTKLRKCGFLFSLLVLLVAAIYLLVSLVIVPHKNEQLKKELIALYHPEKSHQVITKEEAKKGNYPENMLASFTDLYDRNKDVRGWISFHANANGTEDFLDIEYPIVYRDVDDTTNPYLKMDYDGKKNRNGTLFFDRDSQVNNYKDCTDKNKNRSLIVYGHNMASGQMFAGLNKLMGSVNYARAAATFEMSTLFHADTYKVFAVVLIDEADPEKRSYNMWDTEFANDAEFRNFLEGIHLRSMFSYPVDVTEKDKIVVLSTCTGKTSAHVKDGRLLVVARRVRDGEDPNVDTSKITKKSFDSQSDDSVVMPYSWYINQNKPVHKYYKDNGLGSGGPQINTAPSTQQGTTTTTQPGQTTTTGTATGTDTTGTTDSTGSTDVTNPTDVNGSTVTTAPSESTTSGSSAGSSATSSTTGTPQPTESTKPECKHQYDNACDATCNVEGCGYERSVEHVYANACDNTCNTAGCEHKRDVPDHVYDNACDKECNACGNKREVEDHHYGEPVTTDPTCGKDGSIKQSCTECGYTYTVEVLPATNEHTFGEDGKCTVCSAEKSDE